STPRKLRLATGNLGAAPSWDSHVAAKMLRMFCYQYDPSLHCTTRMSSKACRYSSKALNSSAVEYDLSQYSQSSQQEQSSSIAPTNGPEQSKSIDSFLTPPGSEAHYSRYDTIADSFNEPFLSRVRPNSVKGLTSFTSDPVSPAVMLDDAINSKNAKQIWHTYTRLLEKTPSESRHNLFKFPFYSRILHCFQATKTAEVSGWALTIFDDMTQHYIPTVATLNTMLDILTRRKDHDPKEAIEFFKQNALRYNITANVRSYNLMIRGLGTKGQLDAAHRIYEEMRTGIIPLRPDVVTYSTLINQYSRMNMQIEADAILDDMFKDKVEPNLWIFNSVIKRFVHKKDYDSARRTMALMKTSGLQPDVVTYSTLIDGYAQDGNEEALAQIQSEMATNNVYPNAQTITSTIKVFARANLDADIDSQLAGVLKSLPVGEMNELTFGVLVNVYGKRKDLDAAMGIYNHIVSKKRAVNDVIVNTILDGYVQTNRISAAHKLFHDHFTARGIRPSSVWSYNIMISGCCNEGSLENALHYYHQMNKFKIIPDSIVCSRMIQLYLHCDQLDDARRMMRLMRNTGVKIPVQTYTIMMDYLSNSRDIRGAMRYYQEMLNSGIDADVHCYTVLINTQIRAKNFLGCDQTFERMIKTGIKPTLHTLTSMVHAHSLQGNIERAKGYWNDIEHFELQPDLKAFTALMQTYSRQSNVEMVEFIFKEIDRRQLQMDAITLMIIIGAYGSLPKLNVRRVDEISGMLEERDLEPNGEYFRVLLDTYGRHGLPDRVIKTWKHLLTLDKPLIWTPSTSNLLYLIEACRDRGYIDTLRSIWQSAITSPRIVDEDIVAKSSVLCKPWTRPKSDSGQQAEQGQEFASISNHIPSVNVSADLASAPESNMVVGYATKELVCPDPEVFTAYLNALLTHNRFEEIEILLDKETCEIQLMPRSEDLELLFTSLAQYGFLHKELASIRQIVIRRWPDVEPFVDKIIVNTRKI
ncbi:hypothetical protein FBU30_001137, partial [Linnemannia zychae]